MPNCHIKILSCLLAVVVSCASAQSRMGAFKEKAGADQSLLPKVVGEEVDFKTVETISYQLYLDNNWEQLTDYCEKAIKAGYDYYYIRVRSGIGYFELKQYRKAIEHFEKSLEFNSGDDYATSYLYACYLNTERYEDAKWLTKSFSPVLAESMRSKELSAIDVITFESGFKKPDSSRVFKNPFFTSVSLSHSLAKRVFLFHNLSFYKQNESRFTVDQLQYYLRGNIPLKKGFQLSAGFHYVRINTDVRTIEQTVSTYTYEVMGPQNPPPPPVTVVTVNNTDVIKNKQYNNCVGSVAVSKHFTYLDLSLGATAAKFDTIEQYQVNAGFTFYPLKNNRVSLGANAYLHYEHLTNLAVAPYVSIYITPKINLAANYFYNEGPNLTEGNGYFISNSIDYTLHRMALTGSVKINTSLWLYGTYGYEIKKQLTLGYHYNYHIFALGLRIIPQFK